MKLPKLMMVAFFASACVTPALSGERQIFTRNQSSKLNLNIIIYKGDEKGSDIKVDQTGKNNTSITSQGMKVTGTFQFSGDDLPLNKVYVTQHGPDSAAFAAQRGINNDAVVVQVSEPDKPLQTNHHTYSVEELENGGFRMIYQTGEVDMDLFFDRGGVRASSSFGRSH